MRPLTPVISAAADIDRTAVIDTDDTVQQSERQSITQPTVPTPASTNNEAALISVTSLIPSAETWTTRHRSNRESNDSAGEDIDSAPLDNLKRRRLDLDAIAKCHNCPYPSKSDTCTDAVPGYVRTDSLPTSCVLRLPEHK